MEEGQFSANENESESLALVDRSPAAVAAHDKGAWLALFADYSIVEDPVGSAPHVSGLYDAREGFRGQGPLSRFYDTFIAPNDIRFHVTGDVVCRDQVVRDLTIEIAMSDHITVYTPAHLLYELVRQDDELKIFRLAAHWELWPMLKQQVTAGRGSIALGLSLGWRMTRLLGVGGVMGFMRALSSVGKRGKAQVEAFVNVFNQQRQTDVVALFYDTEAVITLPASGTSLSVQDLLSQGGQLSCDKLIAAGNIVSASVCHQVGPQNRQGVAFFEFERRSARIVALSLYLGEAAPTPE